MLPNRQSLAILVQRSIQLASKCGYSGSRNQGRSQGPGEMVIRKMNRSTYKQDERTSKYYEDNTQLYVQNFRKNRVQTFRVHNPKFRWADFCKRMIYKNPV